MNLMWLDSLQQFMKKYFSTSADVSVSEMSLELLEDFLFLPERLYRHEPRYVKPPKQLLRRQLRIDENPLLRASRCKSFLAFRGTAPVARILCGMFSHPPRQGDAFFSLFEASDEESGVAVIARAMEYAHANGASRLRGPWPLDEIFAQGGLCAGDVPHRPTFPNIFTPQWYNDCMRLSGLTPVASARCYCLNLPSLDTAALLEPYFIHGVPALCAGNSAPSYARRVCPVEVYAYPGREGEGKAVWMPDITESLARQRRGPSDGVHIRIFAWDGARPLDGALTASLLHRARQQGFAQAGVTLPGDLLTDQLLPHAIHRTDYCMYGKECMEKNCRA